MRPLAGVKDADRRATILARIPAVRGAGLGWRDWQSAHGLLIVGYHICDKAAAGTIQRRLLRTIDHQKIRRIVRCGD